MSKRLRTFLYELSNYMELFMAIVVVVGIVISILGLKPEILTFWNNRGETGSFYVFLDAVFEIVISIEFLKMLCQPDADTVLEVLIFLVSRHMIIGDTSVFEDFVSILGVAVLFGIRKYIRMSGETEHEHNIFSMKKRTTKEDTEYEQDKQ